MRDSQDTAPGGGAIDRRAVLAGAAGVLLGVELSRPAQGLARAQSLEGVAASGFDPVLARRLQRALDHAVAASGGGIPGAILHVERAGHSTWTGSAGLARIAPDAAMRPEDRFPAGSIMKSFIAAAVLQLVERGRLTLDASLPTVLPGAVTDHFPGAAKITVRMLLDHRSGLPDWSSPATDIAAVRQPGRVWKASDFLAVAAAKKPLFPPGARYGYSNTNYTLLGLVIDHAAERGWRQQVTEGIIKRLALRATVLPPPGDRSELRPYAHGYVEVNGRVVDASSIDPSMAGAAGGFALVTTVRDLVRFLDALLAGRLFRRRETLQAMLTFKRAPDPESPGQVGYGLGLIRRVLPGGVGTIDHYGGSVVYAAYVGRLPRQKVTFAAAVNGKIRAGQVVDASPLLFPVVQALS
jgi:D-alanyl-D-alanine carboxypeptidase